MPSTRYSVQVATADGTFENTEPSFAVKATAVAAAEAMATDKGVACQVVTGAGNVVFEVAAPTGKRVIANKTVPWTRVQVDLPEGYKVPKGYAAAYARSRAGLVVLRAEDKTHYLVAEVTTGVTHRAVNTKETSAIMVALGKASSEVRATEAATAKAAKAEAKATAKAAKEAEAAAKAEAAAEPAAV